MNVRKKREKMMFRRKFSH